MCMKTSYQMIVLEKGFRPRETAGKNQKVGQDLEVPVTPMMLAPGGLRGLSFWFSILGCLPWPPFPELRKREVVVSLTP